MLLKSISQSKLKSWEYCKAGFYQQYVLGLDLYNPHFEGGTEYHKSVELYHKGVKSEPKTDYRGNLMVDEHGRSVGEDIYDAELIKHYRGDCDCSGKLEHGWVKADEVLLGPDGHVMVEERITDLYLEHPKTGAKLPLPLTLAIDRVASMDKLADLKTSAAAWNQKRADEDIQATIYCFAWWQIHGIIPEFEFNIVRKNPGPRTKAMDILTTYRDISDFAAIWDWAFEIVSQINGALEFPCTCYDGAHRTSGLML